MPALAGGFGEDTLADHVTEMQVGARGQGHESEKIIKLQASGGVWITRLTGVVLFLTHVRLAYGTKELTGIY